MIPAPSLRSLLLGAAFLAAFLLTSPLSAQLFNVADSKLGATAKGSNSAFNKDWPPQKAITEVRSQGTIFNPFEGAVIDIRLVVPVDIESVEVAGLDYRGTKFPSGMEVYIEGKKVAQSDLPNSPDSVSIPAKGFGQNIRLITTGSHPRRTLPDGKTGPDYGGLGPIKVMSKTDLAAKMAMPPMYQVAAVSDSVQSTAEPAGSVDVFVDVRQTEGHPRTFWDKQDIAEYQKLLKTSPLLKEQLDALKRAMDERIAEGPGVPAPRKNEAGAWLHLPQEEVAAIHNKNASDISNLGIVYALTGETKYGEFGKQMLITYADAFPNYAEGNRPGFTHDSGKLFDQRLSDATWLIPVVRGYDLIYNLPSITPTDRTKIETDLLKASADFIAKNQHVLRAPTNWSAICTSAVLITGIVLENQEMIDLAMYGPKGTKEKPTGGVMLHFSDKSIGPDGLWSEGAMGYQGMAMQALITNAEILRHHGLDLYSYRDSALKKLFDSPIEIAYPDLTAPAMNDSSRISIVGHEAYLWEYGYLRYRDPRYLTILDQTGKRLSSQFQQFPVSILYEDLEDKKGEAFEWKSVNFFDVGLGILRNTSANGTTSLLLDYGPSRSHAHPSKLNIDLYAFDDQLIPDPGMVWYELPLYKNWYSTTVAHNTLVVDELDQMKAGGNQLVYGSGDTIGAQRANSDKVYAGVMMDRGVFLTPDYIADIYGAFAELPRKLDLAWHIRGDMTTQLPVEPFAFKAPVERGYSELANLRTVTTSDPYTIDFKRPGGRARFHAAGGQETQVILGEGWLRLERPTAILQRRETNKTIYGNVVELDYDDNAFVKSVKLDGSLETGHGLLTVETPNGMDYCFVSYRPGMQTAGPIKTDALQAYVRNANNTPTALFLGGGQVLESNGAILQRDQPGLALLEKADNGSFILANPSPTAGKISVKMASLDGLEAFALGDDGNRSGAPVKVSKTAGGLTADLAASARIELAKPGGESLFTFRQSILKKVQEEQEAMRRKAFDECVARTKARELEAEGLPIPSNTILVLQADQFTEQGGGEVKVVDNKKASIGKSFSGWNDTGHWLEYTVEAPAEGFYNLSAVYCTQLGNSERIIAINGEVQEPFAPLLLPVTGGWSNNSDDWRLLTLMNPTNKSPLLIKLNAGENTIRMTNSTGIGANLDYLLVTSPDVTPVRLPATNAQ